MSESTHQSTDPDDLELHYECVQFYNREAALLDAKDLYCRTEHFAADVRSEAVPGRLSRLSVSPEFTYFCPTVLEAWLELLTDDVEYDMPLRVTREKGAERSEFSEEAYNYREDRGTLEARVERFQSEFAWSEDPPSRTRHHVSNVQVTDVDGDAVHVKNNLLLFRGQGEDTSGTVLSGERQDTLRRVDGELQLARRDIRLDHTILPIKNISVFF